MKRAKMIIKNAEDFGLGFNCMGRQYIKKYDSDILDDMLLVINRYLPYFSIRTVVCTIRDLMEKRLYCYFKLNEIPREQRKRFDTLLETLTKQGITLKRLDKNNHTHDEESMLLHFGEESYLLRPHSEDCKFLDKTDYLNWIYSNGLNEPAEIIKLQNEDELPIKRKDLELFYKVCFYMIHYSYGRHSYMPSVCTDFITTNISLFDDKTIDKTALMVENYLKDYPETSNLKS